MSSYIDWSNPRTLNAFKRVPPTFGELIEAGFEPFDVPDWDTLGWFQTDEEKVAEPFESAQMERFKTKFLRRYKPRIIGIWPPDEWRDELVRMLGELLPKYQPLYKLLSEGIDPLSVRDTYGKERNVYSTFPVTQLDTKKQDYARDARDREFETFEIGDFMEKVNQLQTVYQDADVMLLDDLEGLFDCMLPNADDWYTWPKPWPVVE